MLASLDIGFPPKLLRWLFLALSMSQVAAVGKAVKIRSSFDKLPKPMRYHLKLFRVVNEWYSSYMLNIIF